MGACVVNYVIVDNEFNVVGLNVGVIGNNGNWDLPLEAVYNKGLQFDGCIVERLNDGYWLKTSDKFRRLCRNKPVHQMIKNENNEWKKCNLGRGKLTIKNVVKYGDDKPNGFRVTAIFESSPAREFNVKDAIKLHDLYSTMEPYKFSMVPDDKRSTFFVKGKDGLRMADVPVIDISKVNTKPKVEQKPKRDTGADSLINMVNIVGLCDGYLIRLSSDEAYKRIKNRNDKVGDEFFDIGIGEATSEVNQLKYSETTLNTNSLFKKPGMVMIPGIGQMFTYTMSTKTLFKGMECNIEKLGIAVPRDRANDLKGSLGDLIEPIDDPKAAMGFSITLGKPDLVLFRANIGKLKLLSDSYVKDILREMSLSALYSTVKKLALLKVELKIIKQFGNEYADLLSKSAMSQGKLANVFTGRSDSEIMAIREAGIDPVSGAYTKRKKDENLTSEEKLEDASSPELIIELIDIAAIKKAGIKDVRDVAYGIVATCPYYITNRIVEVVKKLDTGIVNAKSQSDYDTIYKNIVDIKTEISKAKDSCLYELWKYKMALLTVGKGKVYIEKSKWKEGKASKKYEVYVSTDDKKPIRMKLSGIKGSL